jgi:hypothetical protein
MSNLGYEAKSYRTVTIDSPSRRSSVGEILDGLEKELAQLEENIAAFHACLAMFTLPDNPTPAVRLEQNIAQPHSDLYVRMDTYRMKLAELNASLSNLSQRIDS